jgi:hypothetical protein
MSNSRKLRRTHKQKVARAWQDARHTFPPEAQAVMAFMLSQADDNGRVECDDAFYTAAAEYFGMSPEEARRAF